jgi:ABC-type glycerol-3-phosphate transport system substrate-binding protein
MFKKILNLILIFIFSVSFSSCRNKSSQKVLPKKQTVLKVWNLFDSSDVFKGQIEEYESMHPNIDIEYKTFSNLEEYEDLLINEIAEGKGPDIFALKNTWIEKHQGKIFPFPEGKTSQVLTPAIFDQTFFHIAYTDLVKDQKIYGLPLSIDTLALYYNKQIFRDNILSTDKPADNWEDIKKQVTMITKEDNSLEKFNLSGIALGRTDNINRFYDIFTTFLLQHNTKIFNNDYTSSIISQKQGIIKDTKKSYYPFLESLKLYTSFADPKYQNYSWNKYLTAKDTQNDKEVLPFLEGKTAMIAGFSYLYEDLLVKINKNSNFIKEKDIGIIEFPQISSFKETGKRDIKGVYFPLTVSRNSQDQIVAWDFLQFLTNKKSLQTYFEKTKKVSSRKDLVETQVLDPIYGVFAKQASFAKSFPDTKILPEKIFKDIFKDSIENTLKNKKTLNQITNETQSIFNCFLEKYQQIGTFNKNCLP